MQRLDASTSPVGVTMLRRIKLDANGSLDGSTQPRRLDARLDSSMPGLSFHPGTHICNGSTHSNTQHIYGDLGRHDYKGVQGGTQGYIWGALHPLCTLVVDVEV